MALEKNKRKHQMI